MKLSLSGMCKLNASELTSGLYYAVPQDWIKAWVRYISEPPNAQMAPIGLLFPYFSLFLSLSLPRPPASLFPPFLPLSPPSCIPYILIPSLMPSLYPISIFPPSISYILYPISYILYPPLLVSNHSLHRHHGFILSA